MKDPAFLMYSKDWIEGTAEFSPAEKGIYIDLLCFQHQRGCLPSDISRIAVMVGLPENEFLRYWEVLKCKFPKNDAGNFANQKLSKVGSERSAHSKMRTIVGTFGAILRSANLNERESSKIRKLFNYKNFLNIEEANLKQELTKLLSKCLPIAHQTLEDANAIEDAIINRNKKEKDKKPEKLTDQLKEYNFNGFVEIKEKVFQLAEIIDNRLPQIQKMTIPLSTKEICQLVHDYPSEVLLETLVAMNNYKKLHTNNTEAYQTCWTWIKKRERDKK